MDIANDLKAALEEVLITPTCKEDLAYNDGIRTAMEVVHNYLQICDIDQIEENN